MNASIKLLLEESIKLERLVNIKTTLLKLPVNILTTKEIKEIKEAIDFLSNEFDLIKEEEAKYLSRNRSLGTKFDDSSVSDSRSDRSDVGDQDMLIINKLFLNSIVTTNDIRILKRKPTLEEERKFIMELFKINELFPSSISKQLILVDFYMEIYSFCLANKFTIEHMSTIFSIFYFLFSYSFINSNIVVEKSLSLFSEILDFHAMNRPPFSYEIFTQKERDLIYAFGRSSFYRNYSLFENIFQYEVSICFFSKDPRPIPYRSLPPLPTLKDTLKCVEPIPEILRKLIDEKEVEVDEEEATRRRRRVGKRRRR